LENAVVIQYMAAPQWDINQIKQ